MRIGYKPFTATEGYRRIETPIYMGGMSKEVSSKRSLTKAEQNKNHSQA